MNATGREHTGRAIFCHGGELLCKVEYANWHLKDVLERQEG